MAVAVEAGEPHVTLSTFLATGADGDRLSREPYHVAHELARGPRGEVSAAAAAVAEGRGRQDRLAANGLRSILDRLDDTPVVAALLVNRVGWITDVLDYSLAWPEHVPVAEGLAVRDALRFACNACGCEVVELDEKSLPDRASDMIGLSATEIDARLKRLGTTVGRPWRKEQKLAALAAWVAASSPSPPRTVKEARPRRGGPVPAK